MSEHYKKRTFEILTGALAWFAIFSPVWGAIFIPELIANFIVMCNAFVLYKAVSMSIFFIVGFFKIINGENQDWMSNLHELEDIDKAIDELQNRKNELKKAQYDGKLANIEYYRKFPRFMLPIIFRIERRKTLRFLHRRIKKLEESRQIKIIDWRKLHHVVIIPFWTEPYPVLKRTVDKLAKQSFSTKRISIVLGAEERHAPAYEVAKQIKKEYEGVFENIWINNHVITPDEIVGKSSNMASCGRYAAERVRELGWDFDYLTITSCDSDTQFDRQYFAYLSYLFVCDQDRYVHYYAAPMVYYANIWKVPFYSRLANSFFTIYGVSNAAREDKYIQVSSYSFSWKLLEAIDFWSVNIIPEDFHMFFKALFKYGNVVHTIPIFLRNLADAAESTTHRSSIKNQYEQVKRWAWGASDIGWMVRSMFTSEKKSFYMFYRVFHTILDHMTWSTLGIIMLVGANIPLFLNQNLSHTVIGVNLPEISSFMLSLTTITFFFTIPMDIILRPRREGKTSIYLMIFEYLQWFLMPAIILLFGWLPGLDSQTRLLFGKYIEYRVTEKH